MISKRKVVHLEEVYLIETREHVDYVHKIEIKAPLAVYLPRKTMKDKRIAVNLNTYRNLHFLVNNQAKKIYAKEIDKYIRDKKMATPVTIEYRVYKQSKRHLDKMNVVSVTSKYLLDALTEAGVWPDDNDDYVKTEIIHPTRIDKENPRCEVIITYVGDEERLINVNEI